MFTYPESALAVLLSPQPRHIPRGAPSEAGRVGAYPMVPGVDGTAAPEPILRESDDALVNEVRR